MAIRELTADRLRELFHYDPETGNFARKVSTKRGGFCAGDIAGCVNGVGYVTMAVDGRRYLSHRLAFIFMTGRWPSGQVDHIDTNRANNRWQNLRDVPRFVNQQNRRGSQANNEVGLLGVSRNRKRWRAEIKTPERRICLGTFDTPEEAHAAYVAAKRRLHEGCTL